jgi:hypothetical protein
MPGNAWTTAQRPSKKATTLTSWLTSCTPTKPTSVKPAQEVLLCQEATLSVGSRRGGIDTCALGVPQHVGATEDAQAQAAHARSVWAGGLNI